MTGILVLGAGGHGKVVADILLAQSMKVTGFLDDNATLWGSEVLGLPVLSRIEDYATHTPSGLVLGIGDNPVRRVLVEKLGADAQALWISALHPAATIAPSARIGPGSVIMAGAVVNPDAVIGAHGIVNTGATVDHDCVLGDYVHVGPGAHLAGGVEVGEGSLVGIGAAVLPYVSIGEGATIGAGACVTESVSAGVTVVGVPARPISRS